MRPEAIEALAGVELIVHAGDIGSPAVIEALRAVAPVVAVRGNNDRGPWADTLPATLEVEFAGHRLYLLHALQDLDLDPAVANFDVVVSGHSHRPAQQRRDGVLYLNPGSAGPRRFKLPVSVALLGVGGGLCDARVVELKM